jgi:DNA-binding MarR family transcriptional regulator
LLFANIFFNVAGKFKPMKSQKCGPTGAAFLLSQLGAHAAQRFAQRIRALGISPPHAGILRMIGSMPDCSQQKLAKRMGVVPSRIVVLIDELTAKGLVERQRSARDRRNYELALTKEGSGFLERLAEIAAEHEADLCAALSPAERARLASLCRKIVTEQKLIPDVHPGFRNL